MSETYGESEFYKQESGKTYFAYQNRLGDTGGRLNARKFARYLEPEHRVLDFGCGGGWLLKNLVCAERTGVELNSAAWPTCRENGIAVFGSMGDLPASTLFDRIISHHCLEHVPYPIEALRALSTKLAPGGEMIFVLPIDDWRVQRDHTGTDQDHHLHTWTPRLIANTFAEAGLDTLEVRVIEHAWPPRWEMLNKWLPAPVFDACCGIWSRLRRRRQLFVRAKPKG